MAVQNIAFGTNTAFASVTNINSLASNAAKPLGVVDNSSTLALNYKLFLKITLASSSVSATGTIEVYAMASNDNTDWSDNISPTSSSDISASIKNCQLLAILNANANSQVVDFAFDLVGQNGSNPFIDCPKYFTLIVYNKSGTALPASTHGANYEAITYTVA